MKLKCLNCGHDFYGDVEYDYLGWHSSCPECLNSFDIDTEDMIEVFGHMYKNTDRVEQFSFDCINDNNVPAKEIIETIYYALANINVTVVGCLPTDTSWAVKDYCF